MKTSRRGVPSNDPEAVDRRDWYESMRKLAAERDTATEAGELPLLAVLPPAAMGFVGSFAMELETKEEKSRKTTAGISRGGVVTKVAGPEEVFVRPAGFQASRWIQSVKCAQTGSSGAAVSVRLLIFPGIGQNSQSYCHWASNLSAHRAKLASPPEGATGGGDGGSEAQKTIAVSVVCLPGRLQRIHERIGSVREAAMCVLEAIRDHIDPSRVGLLSDEASSWSTEASISATRSSTGPTPVTSNKATPLILFGHDLGALIAFELAKSMEETAQMVASSMTGPLDPSDALLPTVAWFIASATPPPTTLSNRNADRFETKHSFASDGELMKRATLLLGLATMFEGNNRREMLGLFLPQFRADYTLYEKYKVSKSRAITASTAALSCPVTAVGAVGDRVCSQDDLALWKGDTSSTLFCSHMFNSGGHCYFVDEYNEASMLDYIAKTAAFLFAGGGWPGDTWTE